MITSSGIKVPFLGSSWPTDSAHTSEKTARRALLAILLLRMCTLGYVEKLEFSQSRLST